jgi:Rieske 2Fe-2S family protein
MPGPTRARRPVDRRPSTADLENFDKADWPLHRVAVATWEGFLFISLDERPEPFERAWETLQDRFTRFNLPNLKVHRTTEYDVACNWKLLFQNYSECYHCGPVHPPLAKLTPPTSGENDLTEGPFTGGFMVLNRGVESMTMSGRSCGVAVGDLAEEDMNRVYYYAIFPNMLLSLHPDYVMFHTIWPEGTRRSRIFCSWLFHPATLSDPTFKPDDGVEFWDMTNRQDWHICEQSQLGVESRAYVPGPYSRRSLSVQFDLGDEGAGGDVGRRGGKEGGSMRSHRALPFPSCSVYFPISMSIPTYSLSPNSMFSSESRSSLPCTSRRLSSSSTSQGEIPKAMGPAALQ